jgi:single-strand DNA-binding protein
MTIIGRITKDATINVLKDERKVINFSIAVNESFRPKGGNKRTETTFFNCAYWVTDKLLDSLKKGTLVEITGRVYASIYTDPEGKPKAALNCHVNNIKIHQQNNKSVVSKP